MDVRLDARENTLEINGTRSCLAVYHCYRARELTPMAVCLVVGVWTRNDEDLRHLQVPMVSNNSSRDFERVVGSGLTP